MTRSLELKVAQMSLSLSARELAAIASCADTMVRPLDYPSLDAWRVAVLDAITRVVSCDVAFFNVRGPPDGSRVALSREITGPLLDQYERLCVNDAGYERAVGMQLSAVSQTMVVGGNWDAYHADPAVAGFYAPNKIRDALCLVLADPASGLASTIELHVPRYGTRAFGARGVAILQLLLPSFRAGLTAAQRGLLGHGQLADLLNASGGALRAIDQWGRCLHETPRVGNLLIDDPRGADVLAGMAQLARQVSAAGNSPKLRAETATLPCAARISTPAATYRIEATRVSTFGAHGVVILVSVERLGPIPVPDCELVSRCGLSPREIAVARQLALGSSTQQIAVTLGISVHTARRHSERVFAKLGVHTRSAVAAALLQQ